MGNGYKYTVNCQQNKVAIPILVEVVLSCTVKLSSDICGTLLNITMKQ